MAWCRLTFRCWLLGDPLHVLRQPLCEVSVRRGVNVEITSVCYSVEEVCTSRLASIVRNDLDLANMASVIHILDQIVFFRV